MRHPYYGSIDNEAEVIDLLQRRGVYVVDQQASQHRRKDQSFRHADVVMGRSARG